MKNMKRKSIAIIAALALLPVAGFTQGPPNPPNPPAPPAPPNPVNPPERREKMPKVPVTFLGVETSSVPPVVCDQLALAKGFGLVVDYVVPDSPAAAAGIQQNDILKMLNDQILTEPDQLSKLVRSYSEGTNITFTVLRKGQEQKISVKLAKKEVPQRRSFGPRGRDFGLGDQDFGDLRENLRDQFGDLKDQLGNAKQGMIHDAVMKAHEEVMRAKEEALRAGQRVRDEAQRARDQAQHARDEAQRERDKAQHARDEARRSFCLKSRECGTSRRCGERIESRPARAMKFHRLHHPGQPNCRPHHFHPNRLQKADLFAAVSRSDRALQPGSCRCLLLSRPVR